VTAWRTAAMVGGGLLLALGVAVFSNVMLRQTNKAVTAQLSEANAKVAMMQGEVTACRGMINRSNEEVQRYRVESEAANEAAAKAAKEAMKRPRNPLAGHGPDAMNAWLGALP